MERVFRPEFLNRLDDIIVFRRLTHADLKWIVNLEISKVGKRLKDRGFTLEVTDEAKEVLIERGTSLEYGARPLRRAIETLLEDPLSEELLRGTFDGKNIIIARAIEVEGEKRVALDGELREVLPVPAEVVAMK